ncbi:hypothetical protein EJB05_24232, partial [Eragrostis curvula]
RGRSAGVPLSWLRARFNTFPVGADEVTVTYHARAWVMHMFGTVLFPDATGDCASWMYLPCLMDWDAAGQFSWGSAVLAFLYRQLCSACRRYKASSSLGGCVFLLQLWMWSRLPVGRPRVREPQPWTPEGVLEQLPTAAYVWEHVGAPYAETGRAYVEFRNELDAPTPSSLSHHSFQSIFSLVVIFHFAVNWWPYSDEDVAAVENGLGLNPLCRRDTTLWTMRCPLICFYAVEYHLPIRVMRQFGRKQPSPPDAVSTSIELHKFDRSKQKKVTDFAHHHRAYLDEWRRFEDNCERIHAMHRDSSFRRYLEWYQSSTRYRLRQTWTDRDYADMESSEDENTPYDVATRQGTQVEIGPVLDRVGRDIRRSVNDISNAMSFPAGQPDGESRLRAAMERLQRRLRRVAARCGCRAQTLQDVAPPVLSPERSRASGGSRSRASGGSRSRGRASSSRGASSSRTRSRARDSSFSDASDGNDNDYEEPDVIGPSQLEDAPGSSQATQRTRRPVERYTPGTYALGNKGRGKGKRGR